MCIIQMRRSIFRTCPACVEAVCSSFSSSSASSLTSSAQASHKIGNISATSGEVKFNLIIACKVKKSELLQKWQVYREIGAASISWIRKKETIQIEGKFVINSKWFFKHEVRETQIQRGGLNQADAGHTFVEFWILYVNDMKL